ncbi:M43 family zinc metalloprotease [Spirosoma pomorum]
MTVWTCRPPADEVSKKARLQLVLTGNKPLKPVYFWEDSLHRQLSLELYYYDQNQAFTAPPEPPQFLVDGQPFAGNTFVFPSPGQYTISARVKNRTSDNQLVLTVSRAADYLQKVILKAPMLLLNADSVSQLPLSYELIPKQGKPLDPADYPSLQLLADDRPQPTASYYSTRQVGYHRLYASFLGVPSNGILVTARPAINYPLVRLPVIMHVPQAMVDQVDPAALLAHVNQLFRRSLPSSTPNQADAYIEFYPATLDPTGQPLAVAGLHPLSVTNPDSASQAQRIVGDLLHQWCPRQYLNVVIGIDWYRRYPVGYSYAFYPTLQPTGSPLPSCADLKTADWSKPELPAVYIAPEVLPNAGGTIAHEIGHFLGLGHTFSLSCNGTGQFADVPMHLEAYVDANGLKYSCQRAAFVSDYVMDYHINHRRSFTRDQVSMMRTVLERGSYVPTFSVTNSQSSKRNARWTRETGTIIH